MKPTNSLDAKTTIDERVLMVDAPEERELGWLARRMKANCASTQQCSTRELEEDLHTKLQGVSRIVLFCENRVHFASQLLQQIRTEAPDIPRAVATSSWWEGSSRTGISSADHQIIPWYRSDAWSAWLSGASTALHTPLPPRPIGRVSNLLRRSSRQLAGQNQGLSNQKFRSVLVLSNCIFSAGSWREWFSSNDCETISAKYPLSLSGQVDATKTTGPQKASMDDRHFDYILWDDECIDRMPRWDLVMEVEEVSKQIQNVKQRFSSSKIFAAFTMPRWDTWHAALQSGASEILIKPVC